MFDPPPQGLSRDLSSKANLNQPKFSEYEPNVNNNRAQPDFKGEGGGQKLNFNPSFQPTDGDAYQPTVRQSNQFAGNERTDEKKKKAAYAEDLRNQMKQHEVQKQHEKNDVRHSYQANNSNIS